MRLFHSRKSSRFVVGGSALLLALSIYGSTAVPTSTMTGLVTAKREATSHGTLHSVQEFGTTVSRTRRLWRTMRQNLRTTPNAPQTETVRHIASSVTLNSAQLSQEHLEVSYALLSAECVSLWITGAANQRFQRLSVIGGIPCSVNTGALSARLLLSSVQPTLSEGQLIKLCTNATQQCSQPIVITQSAVSASHGAAGTSITIHSAVITRNSSLSVTYSKAAGCTDLVRWNGIGDNQRVTFQHTTFSCSAVDHEIINIGILGMQPVLGPNQWIHLCDKNSPTTCSNVIQIR
ncbi:MAG: hypothetical protein Greene041662_716 [Candidatus Peregrinibacteria bacterium Greene0416_62]|nr:MAG: hypothetical protein Greene041662_716 [Candidatus Peregrinibacteria bacterium Greene0416_62]